MAGHYDLDNLDNLDMGHHLIAEPPNIAATIRRPRCGQKRDFVDGTSWSGAMFFFCVFSFNETGLS